jgi:predicted ATP-dependent Lon-type protease
VEGTISDMQFGMTEYSSSIEASLDAVHLVQAYALIGEELCDHLRTNDQKMISDSIARMKDLAEQSEEQATKAVKMFRSNRRKLNRVCSLFLSL